MLLFFFFFFLWCRLYLLVRLRFLVVASSYRRKCVNKKRADDVLRQVSTYQHRLKVILKYVDIDIDLKV